MKRLIILFLTVLVFAANTAYADFKKTKIAVMDFQVQGEKFETEDIGKIVAEWLITALVQEGRFDVVERRLLEKILQEQKLSVSGVVDSDSIARLGKVLGAKIVVTGSVMKLRQFMEVNARLINVENGSIIAAEKVKSESATKLEALVTEMAVRIISDFPLEGYVVERGEDNTVTIDIGKLAGAKVGKRFIVFKEGKAIKHPKTGEVLDIERIDIGEVEVRAVKEKTATGVILREASGQKIEYGNMVRSSVEASTAAAQYSLPEEKTMLPAEVKRENHQATGQFNIGEEYYLLTTIHAVKNTATWENRTDWQAIHAGEKVVLTQLVKAIAKFTWKGNEYIFVYHHAKVPNPYMLSKFLTKDDPGPVIAGFPEDVKSYIASGEAKVGMTRWQMLYS
ncbi:MAG: FlgO family outer membrane protein, partial [Deltaproteobacteria bacterium]